jgi:hypothetical protein
LGFPWLDIVNPSAEPELEFPTHTTQSQSNSLCALLVTVSGYRSRGLGSILSADRFSETESGTGSTQPREYN